MAVVVAEAVVEVDLGLVEVAVLVAEGGAEDVAVVDADVLGGNVERHFVCGLVVVVEGGIKGLFVVCSL